MFPRGLLREYASLISLLVRGVDVLAVVAAAYVAFYIRFDSLQMPTDYAVALLIAMFLVLGVFPIYGLYGSWRGKNRVELARSITGAWVTVAVLMVLLAFLTKSSTQFSRQWSVEWAATGWVFLLTARMMVSIVLGMLRERGWNHRRIIVLGAGRLGREVVRHLNEAQWTGLDIVGFFDDRDDLQGEVIEGHKVEGPVSAVTPFLGANSVDEVWIAMPLGDGERVIGMLGELERLPVTVRMVPDIFGFHLLNHSLTEVAGLPVVNLTVTPMEGANRIIKALEDRILSFLILMLISPLMLAIAIAVKLTSRGPVFYRQERVGWNGRSFTMLKFRSMPVDAEEKTGAVWAKKGESRATPFGGFLRRTSLDELPQFLNVLRGDMSIVGPRPERPMFVERFKHEIPGYMKKHLVKAGITGWAQVNGWRGDTDLEKRVECDLYYIENWSLWFDLKIIVLTLLRGFVHKNAY